MAMIDYSAKDRGNAWIQSYSGGQIWPLDLTADQVVLEDIAHALSLKCRFTGHCEKFYSIAQHSVLVASLVPPEWKREALLHDAAEYILPDIATPIKPFFPQLKKLEDRVEKIIGVRFGLKPKPWDACVKLADKQLVMEEHYQNMKPAPGPWGFDVPRAHVTVIPMSPTAAEQSFLERCVEYGII
jgi:hypothetical protein